MNPIKENSSSLEENPNVTQANTSLPINVSGSSPATPNASGINKNYLTPPPNVPIKRVIRKITPIDPKKLQQAGLDRKIAEALSKQKSKQAASNQQSLQRFKKFLKPSTATSNVSSSTSNAAAATTSVSGASPLPAANVQQQSASPAKTVTTPKTIIPPKITITGPESPSDIDRQNLVGLNSQQRLEHVKNLLNKKLLQKKSCVNQDILPKTQSNQHLKPPPMNLNSGSLSVNSAFKPSLKVVKPLPVQPAKDITKSPQLFLKLKEPEEDQQLTTPPAMKLLTKPKLKETLEQTTPPAMKLLTKPKTPQKSPQDIARKLDFQNEVESTKVVGHIAKRNVVKVLNKDYNKEIPKAAIKTPGNIIKPSSSNEFNDIPKASIKPAQFQTSYSHATYSNKQLKHSEQKLEFPEVSPLKVAFPTVNVPKETPLPNIDTFKKPYPLANVQYYDLHNQQPNLNYETSLIQQSNVTDMVVNNNLLNLQLPVNPDNNLELQQEISSSSNNITPANNCLIVLENKVLSQDEMIDLTELRLSNTTTPRFIYPHKPIPEVVIKQEKTDEYPTTNSPDSKEKETMDCTPIQTTSQQPKPLEDNINLIPQSNKETINNNVMLLTTKQNKKVIINAQKLKLPPQQLADLAKKIKQSTTLSPTSGVAKGIKTNEALTANKTDIRILNTKASGWKPLQSNTTKQNAYIMAQNTELPSKGQDLNTGSLIKQNNLPNNITNIESSTQDHNYQMNPKIKRFHNKILPSTILLNPKEHPAMITVKEEPTTQDNQERITDNNSSFLDLNSSEYRQSAVEIIDEPLETEDCFSAVDFIASLNDTQPVTEDTTMELSPEELNLMNITPLSMQTEISKENYQSYTHITSTPKLDHNLLHNPDMGGTIVIESSKGPETILTTDSPKKYGELQKVNRFCNLEVCDMDIEEPLETTTTQQLVLEPLKEPQNIDLTNVIVAKDPEKIKRIISQVKNVNDFDNVNTENQELAAIKTVSVIKKINSPLPGLFINPFSVKERSSIKQQEHENSVTVTNAQDCATSLLNLTEIPLESANAIEVENQVTKTVEEAHVATVVGTEKSSKSLGTTNEKQTSKSEEQQQNISIISSTEKLESALQSTPKNVSETATVYGAPKALEENTVLESISSSKSTKTVETSKEQASIAVELSIAVEPSKTAEPSKTIESARSFKSVNSTEVSHENLSKSDKHSNEIFENQSSNKDSNTQEKLETSTQLNEDITKKSNSEVQEAGVQKTSETSASTNVVTSKRISRFKKGKINLVQRNKSAPPVAPNKTQIAEKKIENEKPNSKDVKENKSLEEVAKEKKEETQITKETNQNETTQQTLKTSSENNDKQNEEIVTNVTQDKAAEQHENQDSLKIIKENKEQTKEAETDISNMRNEVTNCFESSLQNLTENQEVDQGSNSKTSQKTLDKQHDSTADKDTINEPKQLRDDITNAPLTRSQSPTKTPYRNRTTKPSETVSEVTIPEASLPQHKPAENPMEATTPEVKLLQTKPTQTEYSDEVATPKATPKDTEKTSKFPELQNKSHQDNIENIPCHPLTDELNAGSRDILNNMRNAKVSLIDIVKHSPHNQIETSPVIPFKKVCKELTTKSPEVKGIQTLLKQLKNNQKETETTTLELTKDQSNIQENGVANTPKELTTSNKTLEKVRNITTRRSSRCCLKSNETETTPCSSAKSISNRKRHSTRPLISDDDLEFLPVNAEVKFKLSKSQQKENEIETPKTCGITHRRTRLYSKPLEMELSKSNTTPLTKRTRYYSQTLETNVTIEFDTLKAPTTPNVLNKTLPAINSKSLDTEDSCHDSTQESSSALTPSTQRKRLRKTLEDIKKSQKPATDSDTEDDNRDYVCSLNECEESNEFLGFEENTESNTNKITSVVVANEKENNEVKSPKAKGGTLKNWLTTGKAIAPTFEETPETTRMRHDDTNESLTAIHKAKAKAKGKSGIVPLKKRWDLATNHHEETDITDDTSPADDEDEEEVKLGKTKEFPRKFKRGIKNVIDSNKETIDNKKLKLDTTKEEHRFIKPRHLRTSTSKNSGTDSDCHEERLATVGVDKPKLRVKNFLADTPSPNIFKDNGLGVGKESFNESATDSDCPEVRITRRTRAQVTDKLQAEAESDKTEGREGRDSKDKRKSRSSKNETHSENSAVESDCNEKFDMKDNNTNSDIPACKETKRSKSRNITEDEDMKPDNSLITLNSDSDVAKNKRSRRSLAKSSAKDNLDKKEEIPETKIENDSLIEQEKESLEKKHKSNKKSSKKQKKDIAKENGDISTLETSPKKEEEEVESTPQGSTSKKRKRATKPKSEQTPSTKQNEDYLNKTQTSVKRRLSSDTSDDEQPPQPPNKKRVPKRKLKIEDSDNEANQTPLKTDKERQSAIDNLTPIATPHIALVKGEKSTPSRKRKVDVTEANFNPRLLLITKREQLETDEVITETEQGTGPIQCGLCLQRTQATKWTLHLAQHYGVGWKVGEEKANIENRTNVLNIMVNYMKVTHCKGLNCRMCKKQFRSALGLLMHIEICGAQDARVICEYCKKDYAKNSLPVHIRSCHMRNIETSTATEENTEKKEEVFGNTGRLKRHSTIKAENKLKEIGQEFDKFTENQNPNIEFDPKMRIRYVAPPNVEEFLRKWSDQIAKNGIATCSRGRCKFSHEDINELKKHMDNCKTYKSGYFCNFCHKKAFKTEKEAIEHILKNHQSGRRIKSEDSDCDIKLEDEQSSDDNYLSEGVDEDELDDFEGEDDEDLDDFIKDESRKKKNNNKKRNLNLTTNITYRQQVFDGRYNDLSKEILKKWKNFLKANYSCEPLYTEFTTQYSVLNLQDYKKYLPNQTQSMKFNFKINKSLTAKVGEPEDNLEWSELKRYESITNKRNTYYFLGAPIKLCSWLPLPAHINEQYLAVTYRPEMFKFIKFLQPKQHHTVILILKVTVNNHMPQLTIYYGFVVEDGPVHSITFLPSGGYDEANNRLGLVAVGTINSAIKVYSLPLKLKEEDTKPDLEDSTENITLLGIKPKFILNLDMIQQNHSLIKTQCLQICWSEFSGHQHIFASFSNGFIGIWDITNDPAQNLNYFVVDEVINYAALNYFYIGEKSVKSFALHYDTNGPRWLAVSGAYRKFVIYDIRNFMLPVILKEDCNKNILLSMDWCPIMETLLYSYCDAMPNNGRCVMNVNPTNIMFAQNKLDYMVCGVTQVHYTPLTNMCVAAMENGDLLFMDTRELHYEFPLGKKYGERRLLYGLDIKQLDGNPIIRLPKATQNKKITEKAPNDWVMHDDKYKEKYGLVFESLIRLREQDKSVYLHEKRSPPPNVIPYMRINTLRCNLNTNAKNLVALGYENGFLRIVDFNKDIFSKNC